MVCVALPLITGAGELAVDLSAASVAGKGGLGSGSIATGTGWSWCAAVSDIASTTAAGWVGSDSTALGAAGADNSAGATVVDTPGGVGSGCAGSVNASEVISPFGVAAAFPVDTTG